MKELIQFELDEHIKVAQQMKSLINKINQTSEICVKSLQNGHKVLIFGNGGSAADAQHIAAELVGRYKTERKGLPAIALTTDTSALTAIGNDYGYQHIFKRQIEALASPNDVVIGISTSGNSENVISALRLANSLNCHTIGFSGRDGGKMNTICDVNIVVPSEDTPRIQEMHIFIGHTLCHIIESKYSSLNPV